MDVRCGRCGTEYEFDDALVSERGTTVKCTNCGHQFKVRPPDAGAGAPERWVVRTATGRELVYTSLRELQRGIAQRQVGPEDLLSRGNQPPRPLGSIAELEPFFVTRAVPAVAGAQNRTLVGVAPPAAGAPAPAPPTPNPLTQTLPLEKSDPEPRTKPSPPEAEARRQPTDTSPETPEAIEEQEPPTLPRTVKPKPMERGSTSTKPSPVVDPMLTPTPSAVREAMVSYSEMPAGGPASLPVARRATSRWIIGVVLAGIVVLVALTVGRRYLEKFTSQGDKIAQKTDARVQGFLTRAETLLEEADFEAAREQLDKASVLAEGDPAVLSALVRLEALRADVLWLRLRLLDPADEQLVKATHRQLGSRVGRAEQALEKAKSSAAKEPSVLRAEVNVLRLAGKVKDARAKIGPIASQASEPANAYVLAALDLAEPSPTWASVIERLRTASAAERGMGRARAALVYALVRSGNLSGASTELDKSGARAKSHPLYDDLAAFVARHEKVADAGADAQAEVATVDPSSLPVLDTSTTQEPEIPAGDFRGQLRQASSALKHNDLDRAERLYQAVLAKQPGNTEALAGLGDVARLKRDPAKAEKMYEKVLEKNPSYLPAMIAQADAKWANGDRKGALVIYRRVLEQSGPSTSYGKRAAQRISQGPGDEGPSIGGKPSPAPEAGAAPAPTEKPTPKDEPKKEDKPHIDTTDLPGFGK